MATGIEMLLSMLKIDPKEIRERVAELGQIIESGVSTLHRIEARQIRIEKALSDAGLIRADDADAGS